MSPIFKCLICRKDIERSTKTFWVKKGHLLCSTCLDNIDKKKSWSIRLEIDLFSCSSYLKQAQRYRTKETYLVIIGIKKSLLALLYSFQLLDYNFLKFIGMDEWKIKKFSKINFEKNFQN